MPVFASPRQLARVAAVVERENLPRGRNTTAVHAYINHGRWVADCPCNGAELVTPGVDMVCGSCGMTSTITFPSQKTRGDLDRLLEVRPVQNQNWTPDEDLAALVGENIAHGLA